MLEVEGLQVRYGAQLAVQDLSMELVPGRVVALVGANGAGKTSTLSALSGAVRPSGGRIRLEGRDVTGLRPHQLVRLGVTHVPEGRRVIAPLTVEENLLLGAYSRRRERSRVARTLEEVYAMFPILRDRGDRPSGVLSGGEQQMLAFGRAMMARPKVVLLDEPTMGLAPAVVGTVLDAVEELRRLGLAVLMVEQNGAAVTEVADHVHLMERGEVVGGGPTAELAGDSVLRALLGLSEPAPAVSDGDRPADDAYTSTTNGKDKS